MGLYFFKETGNNINSLDFTPVTFRSGGRFKTESYAAFGQATWTALDKIDLSVGLRFTQDDKSFLPDTEILVEEQDRRRTDRGQPELAANTHFAVRNGEVERGFSYAECQYCLEDKWRCNDLRVFFKGLQKRRLCATRFSATGGSTAV